MTANQSSTSTNTPAGHRHSHGYAISKTMGRSEQEDRTKQGHRLQPSNRSGEQGVDEGVDEEVDELNGSRLLEQQLTLLDNLLERMNSRVHLPTVLAETVTDIRVELQADRVLLLLEGDAIGVESTAMPFANALDPRGKGALRLTNVEQQSYAQGRVDVVPAMDQSHALDVSLTQQNWLESLDVKAYVNVPIVAHQQLQGLLVIQQCSSVRTWQKMEVELLQRLAAQLAVAIAQAELRDNAHQLQAQLEVSRSERTTSLKQSLKFAELVLHVTERIRDSLDESQILHTATRELAKALNVERCKIELYDTAMTTATVAYEWATAPPNCIGMTRCMADFPELYQPLRQHQPVQFVVPPTSNLRLINMTRLACPIFDDQGVLGNLWLFRPRNEMFNRWEIRIIQQIANECAIGIRQARLYEASQKQVRELERLNQLKDDFLKTISHELRTPLSSIILGVQTLERLWTPTADHRELAPELAHGQPPDPQTVERLFQTLHVECHRESKLIEDLLTFCYLEAGTEPLIPTCIDLNDWLMETIKPFQLRIQNQHQHLTLTLDDKLPPLRTELAYLERIVSELLNNACKYTPSDECIVISTFLQSSNQHEPCEFDRNRSDAPPDSILPDVRSNSTHIVLQVKNTGIEIPEEEQDRIFDKFYRIPSSDPWKYGGTGLGLALVKKLTECLGASIVVTSVDDHTIFTVLFPVNMPS